MAVITMLNQKGGVGKTSTTFHMGGVLARRGLRVLLVDNDPQSSLTQGLFGPDETRALPPERTVAQLYRSEFLAHDQLVFPTGVNGLMLLAGSRHCSEFNVPKPHEAPWPAQMVLREGLSAVAGRYDVVLIDCPPNLQLCSWAALAASDTLVIPLQPEDYGAQGLYDVMESIYLVEQALGKNLPILGLLITMFNSRRTVHKLFEQTLREQYGERVLATRVPYAAEYPEAITCRKPVHAYKPRSAAAKIMGELADEVLERLAGFGLSSARREVA
jgi:chromosome partitioning protein